MRRSAVALVLALAAAAPARGHDRSVSYSSWRLDASGAHAWARVSRLDLSRLGGTGADPASAAAVVAAHVRLLAAGEPCTPTAAPVGALGTGGWAIFEWDVTCPSAGPRTLVTDLLLATAPSHLHFAEVTLADGSIRERVLAESAPRWELGSTPAAAAGTSFAGYVLLGIEHIASGFDHLAFVLALVLLAGSLREVAGLVTAFTLAHSLTLALAVLGTVRPDAAAVDALIGCSIALVAAENVWLLAGRESWIPRVVTGALVAAAVLAARGTSAVSGVGLLGIAVFARCHFGLLARAERPERLRALAAFAFGLVHGLGFAGVLVGLDLPPARLVPALLGFNLGVEVGQLGFVALLWPPLGLLARTRWSQVAAEAGSAAIAGLGVFWFVSRAWG